MIALPLIPFLKSAAPTSIVSGDPESRPETGAETRPERGACTCPHPGAETAAGGRGKDRPAVAFAPPPGHAPRTGNPDPAVGQTRRRHSPQAGTEAERQRPERRPERPTTRRKQIRRETRCERPGGRSETVVVPPPQTPPRRRCETGAGPGGEARRRARPAEELVENVVKIGFSRNKDWK